MSGLLNTARISDGRAPHALAARGRGRRHRRLRRAGCAGPHARGRCDRPRDHGATAGDPPPGDRAGDGLRLLVRVPAAEPPAAPRLRGRPLDRALPARGGLPAGCLGHGAPVDDHQVVHAATASGRRQGPPGRRRAARRFELPERARADVRGRLRLDGHHGRPPDQAAPAPTTRRGGADDPHRRRSARVGSISDTTGRPTWPPPTCWARAISPPCWSPIGASSPAACSDDLGTSEDGRAADPGPLESHVRTQGRSPDEPGVARDAARPAASPRSGRRAPRAGLRAGGRRGSHGRRRPRLRRGRRGRWRRDDRAGRAAADRARAPRSGSCRWAAS